MSPLLIDVGNTRTKWAQATSSGTIRLLGSRATQDMTPRGAAALAEKYRGRRAIVASVVPGITARLQRAFGSRAAMVTSRTSGLAFAYPRPAELGADRLAGAAAVPGPAIIISCGTATVFNVLDEQGRFCGGIIAPGLAAQLAALTGSTAQLPAVVLRSTVSLPGRSTRAALQAGVLLNFQGGVREILQRLRRETSAKHRVILTGGYAPWLNEARLGEMELRPLLVFEGLHIISQRLFSAA